MDLELEEEVEVASPREEEEEASPREEEGVASPREEEVEVDRARARGGASLEEQASIRGAEEEGGTANLVGEEASPHPPQEEVVSPHPPQEEVVSPHPATTATPPRAWTPS